MDYDDWKKSCRTAEGKKYHFSRENNKKGYNKTVHKSNEGKRWVHDYKALKDKLGVKTNKELYDLGYAVKKNWE